MEKIEEKAIKILNILSENHHEAYIVGGFVRDKLLNIKSNDIDICTSATPKEIMALFPNTSSPSYGSVNIIYKNTNFDITTFRKDIKYQDNRIPVKIKYIKSIRKDLLRRDFTINTLCMNKNGKISDFLNATPDLNNRLIKTVGNPKYRLKEDALRILRAVRFATILDFEIEEKTKYYLKEYAYLLEKLSYQRKKQELDKIFISVNKEKGIKILLELGLDKYLELPNLKDIIPCSDLTGIWTQLNVDDIYPFSKLERTQIKRTRKLLELDIHDKYNIYTYGLYTSTIAFQIKGESTSKLNEIYTSLPIHSKSEIKITGEEIAHLLNIEVGPYLKEILEKIEKNIVLGILNNDKKTLEKYVIKKYKNINK